jgi:hypothetical protein
MGHTISGGKGDGEDEDDFGDRRGVHSIQNSHGPRAAKSLPHESLGHLWGLGSISRNSHGAWASSGQPARQMLAGILPTATFAQPRLKISIDIMGRPRCELLCCRAC